MEPSNEARLNLSPGAVRGVPGYFRLAQDAEGAWQWIDPAGARFFLRAVNEVAGVEDSAHDPVARLRAWGFNALGAGSDPVLREDGLPFVATADFSGVGSTIRLGGARLPDVFDPEWGRAALLHAGEICLPLSERRELVGWITDERLNWAQGPAGGRPMLLQICLSLEPGFAAYHAAWEFVLAMHGGRLDALAKAWAHPITNKEMVRTMTREERAIETRGYARDDQRWTREFARRYFALTSAALRTHAPNHVILGCRYGGRASPTVLTECAYPAIDAAWLDLDDVPLTPGGPIVAGEFSWVDPRFLREAGGVSRRRLTSVERMLRRGRSALSRARHHPAVVGYSWSRWRDEPGEQPPFAGGLVHTNDSEALEHTELLSELNANTLT